MSTLVANNLQSNSGTVTIPSGQKLYAPGSVVQVQHARTSPTRYTVASADISAIPELEINFTPKFSNSNIFLTAMINTTAQYVSTYGFLKNNSVIITNSNNNSSGSIFTMYPGSDNAGYIWNIGIEYTDVATSLSSINYKVAACSSWAGSTPRSLYINDRDSNDMRSISSMTIMEIAQ
jgi:hypothetical protein